MAPMPSLDAIGAAVAPLIEQAMAAVLANLGVVDTRQFMRAPVRALLLMPRPKEAPAK